MTTIDTHDHVHELIARAQERAPNHAAILVIEEESADDLEVMLNLLRQHQCLLKHISVAGAPSTREDGSNSSVLRYVAVLEVNVRQRVPRRVGAVSQS